MDQSAETAARETVDATIKVHRTLGPGLLESVYEHCLAYELDARGVPYRRQLALPIVYGDSVIDAALRLDLLVDDQVIVEVKSVERLAPIHDAQLMTYLKLSRRRLGLLINFNGILLKDGLRRFAL